MVYMRTSHDARALRRSGKNDDDELILAKVGDMVYHDVKEKRPAKTHNMLPQQEDLLN